MAIYVVAGRCYQRVPGCECDFPCISCELPALHARIQQAAGETGARRNWHLIGGMPTLDVEVVDENGRAEVRKMKNVSAEYAETIQQTMAQMHL